MPLSDSFVVVPPEEVDAIVVFGVNCVRPLGEAQEVVYYPRRNAEPASSLQCAKACIGDSGAVFAIVATKPAWMRGVDAGANECGVTACCVATLSEPSDGCPSAPDGSLLAQDFVRSGLERGRTASASVDIVSELVEEFGLTGGGAAAAAAADGCCRRREQQASYACLAFVDKQETWMLDVAGKRWAARRLAGGYCCSADALVAKATYEKSSDRRLSGSHSQISTTASAAYIGAVSDGQRYCLQQKERSQDRSPTSRMFSHLRQAAAMAQPTPGSGRLERVASMVSVMPRSAAAAAAAVEVHWFTATPDPGVSIFKPFVFRADAKQCPLTVAAAPPEDVGDEAKAVGCVAAHSQLCREHSTAAGRLRGNDGKLRDILRQLESECVREMSAAEAAAPPGAACGADGDGEGMGGLFADVCEAEIKFYRKTCL